MQSVQFGRLRYSIPLLSSTPFSASSSSLPPLIASAGDGLKEEGEETDRPNVV